MLPYALNILKTYAAARADEVERGKAWYRIAHNEAIGLARDIGNVSHEGALAQACGIVAALSPGLRWERNINAARAVIRGEPLDGIGVRWYRNVKKADLILQGKHSVLDVLGGNKVRAFYANILEPDKAGPVTIDGHAYAIANAKRISLEDVPDITNRLYATLQDAYVQTAKLVSGLLPHELQAVTWCVWRRLHGVVADDSLPLFGLKED